MSQATLTSKGQITIPASVRRALHLVSGDKIEFVEIAEGRFEVIPVTKEVSDLKGLIKTDKVVSLEAMEQSIIDSAAK